MPTGRQFYAGGPSDVAALQAANVRSVLYSYEAQNLDAAAAWIQVFDLLAAPVLGAVPLYAFKVPSENLLAVQVPGPSADQGRGFTAGIWLAWSSTSATYTPTAALGPIYAAGRNLV